MKYNLTVTICADIAVFASSLEVARKAVEKVLKDAAVVKTDNAEFAIEHHEVTGVYDAEWHAIEEEEVQDGR